MLLQAFEGLAPYPVHHAYDRYAMVDLEAPDHAMWPEFANMRGRVVILQPGDVLFVPRFWYVALQHQVIPSLRILWMVPQILARIVGALKRLPVAAGLCTPSSLRKPMAAWSSKCNKVPGLASIK